MGCEAGGMSAGGDPFAPLLAGAAVIIIDLCRDLVLAAASCCSNRLRSALSVFWSGPEAATAPGSESSASSAVGSGTIIPVDERRGMTKRLAAAVEAADVGDSTDVSAGAGAGAGAGASLATFANAATKSRMIGLGLIGGGGAISELRGVAVTNARGESTPPNEDDMPVSD